MSLTMANSHQHRSSYLNAWICVKQQPCAASFANVGGTWTLTGEYNSIYSQTYLIICQGKDYLLVKQHTPSKNTGLIRKYQNHRRFAMLLQHWKSSGKMRDWIRNAWVRVLSRLLAPGCNQHLHRRKKVFQST